jgi:hypothetical protein
VHRALQQLGITLIPAYSPEARGRSERVFRTLQDRLPKELALAGITEMVAANAFLRTRFVPAYNQRFAAPAAESGTAFVPWRGANLADLLCVQEDRVVANDNTVRYQGRSLQIPSDTHRFHYVKVTVRVHAYPDGTLAVFHGPRCLARYHADGRLIDRQHTPSGDQTAVGSCHQRQLCAKYCRREAEPMVGGENRTDHVLHKPDNLTCYLQKSCVRQLGYYI